MHREFCFPAPVRIHTLLADHQSATEGCPPAPIQQKVFSIITRLVERLVPHGVPPSELPLEACEQFLDLMTITWRGPHQDLIGREEDMEEG